MAHAPPVMEALSQKKTPPTHKLQKPQPKQSQTLWVKIPGIYPTKVLFTKDKKPDGIILPPAAIALVLIC
jgi:hypothetical protein